MNWLMILFNILYLILSEEMAAETINAITDIIIAGDESKFIQSVKNYMNQDYSYTDAINKTITDNFYNVLSAGVVGGFTGAVLGGVSGKPNDEIKTEPLAWNSDLNKSVHPINASDSNNNLSQLNEGVNNTNFIGDVAFSLKKVNGKNIVWIEENGLTNKQLNNHQTVAKYIEQHIGDVYTIMESGQKVYIGEDLPQEYTQSKSTSYLRNVNRTAARGKNKAIGGFGELIETATNRRWEKTKHTHNKDAKYGMYRYDNSFAFPVKDNQGNITNVRSFDVELLIRNASDGNKYLYDIVGIKENTTSEIGLLERMTRLPVERQATRDSASINNIPQKDGIVNNYDMQNAENNAIADELNFARENASGIEVNENDSRKMKLAKKVMRALNERYGVNFKIYSGESLNGFYHNGTVYINEKSEKPILSVIGHEFLHGFKDIDAEGYALLKSVTESDLRLADYERYKKNLLSDWKEAGIDISALSEPELKNAILEEAMSDMMGEIINDPETIRKIALEDKNLAERIMAYLKDFIEQIRTLFDENDAEIQSIFHNYEQVKAVYQEVVAQSNGRVDGDTNLSDITYLSTSSKNLANNTKKGYNEYWKTDLTKSQLKIVEGWIRQTGSSEATRITDTANWYKGRLDGEDLFVIYSTENSNNPTILYEVKGGKASSELDILMDLLEEKENGKSINGKSSFAQRISEGNWMPNVNGGRHNISRMGSGQNHKDAGILQGQPQGNPSRAFENVIRNLFEKQEQDGRISGENNYSNASNTEYNKIEDGDKPSSFNASDVKLSVRKGSRAEKAQRAMEIYEESGNVADLPTRQWAKEFNKAAINTEKMIENQIATAEWEKRYAKNDEQKARLDKVLAELKKQQEENVANVKISGELIGRIEGSIERNYNLADIINDLKDVDKGLKIKSGNYRFNDFYRNFERVFGKHFDKIKPLLDSFDDAKGNESKYRIGKLTEQYDYIVKQLGIKKGSKESKAVQWIAEGERNPDVKNKDDIEALKKMGITDIKNLDPSIRVPYTEAMLRAEFGEAADNILKAEQWYRKQYDEMINAINATQRRIYPNRPEKLLPKRKDYMRHFREVKTGLGGLLDLIKADVQIAPGLVSVSEHTSPKEKWASFKQKRAGKATSEGAIEGFNEYIGQASYAIYINPYIEQFRGLARDLAELKSAGSKVGVNQNADKKGKNIIRDGMSDAERYNILVNKSIENVPKVDNEKLRLTMAKLPTPVDEAYSLKGNDRKKLFVKLGEEFNVFKNYENKDIELSFEFTKERMRESEQKQNGNYETFAKMFSVFDEVIERAVGIEVHNRNSDGYKTDPTLNEMYVLVSAFEDGENIIPVKLEIKEFNDKENKLYVAVALESIKKNEVVKEGNTKNSVTQASRSFNISLSQLLINVNPNDTDFLKYIPRQFFDNSNINSNTQIRRTDNPDLNGFIEYLNDFANDLAGKTGGLDRALIKSMGASGRTVI